MSAYIVDKNHIAYILASASHSLHDKFGWYYASKWHYLERSDIDAMTKAGQMLMDENFASVCDRYPSYDYEDLPGPNDNEYIYKYDPSCRVEYDPIQLLMSISCLDYQSCEHDGWEASEAKALLKYLVDATIRKLPGYDKAVWGAPDTLSMV